MGTVLLIGTMDTKGAEYEYVKNCIDKTGNRTLLMDLGVLKDSPEWVDYTSADVAEAGGCSLERLRSGREGTDTRAKALHIMQQGAQKIISRLVREKVCNAVLGMGGSGGTSMLAEIFQSLPIGFPKILVSTIASGDVSRIVGSRDIMLMYSVTDIAGLNAVSRKILGNAANAAAGMAAFDENLRIDTQRPKPLIGITMFGVTTPGVLRLRERLEKEGFESIIFHTTGYGGRAMEDMITDGTIDGVIDYTVAELNGHYITGMNDAGPDRLTAASKRRIPQVVVPGAIEVCNFPGIQNLPEAFRTDERKVIEHNPLICAAKASEEELQMLGMHMGEKLCMADKTRTAFVFPMRGLDSYEAPDGPWEDKEADQILLKAILRQLPTDFPVYQFDANINDCGFADKVFDIFIDIWDKFQVS